MTQTPQPTPIGNVCQQSDFRFIFDCPLKERMMLRKQDYQGSLSLNFLKGELQILSLTGRIKSN